MKESSRRVNWLIAASLAIIAAAFLGYASVIARWFSRPLDGGPSSGPADRAAALERLAEARREFRRRPLEARAHLRLADALWRAARPVDSFYVSLHARRFFDDRAFRAAHAEAVLGAGGPAAKARAQASAQRDALSRVRALAELARDHGESAEGRDALDALLRAAAGPGEEGAASLQALDELSAADPRHPGKLAARGLAHLTRGDPATAHAVASDALAKLPGHPGAATVMGALALHRQDPEAAARWLTAAWEREPNDLYAAAKLAQIHAHRRGDPEAALPFRLALHRQNPDFEEDGEPVESLILRTLDARRESLLRHAPVEGLGARLTLDDASLRAEACLKAAEYQDPRWIAPLGELLDDDAEIVRKNADYALFKIGQKHPEAVRERRADWLAVESPLARTRALNLFADLDGKNALPLVIAALRDPNPAVRALTKVMVLDHYFRNDPDAAKARARYEAEETDPDARSLLARFPPR